MSQVFTASWRSLYIAAQQGALPVQPVRISFSVPRYWPQAAEFSAITELIPTFHMRSLEGEAFADAYRAHLDRIDPQAIAITNRLRHIAERSELPWCFSASSEIPAAAIARPRSVVLGYHWGTALA